MANSTEKLGKLIEILSQMGSVLVAYSGGVDSTFLLKVSRDTLGDGAVAVTARSETFPSSELEECEEIVKMLGVRHVIVESHELHDENFASNPPDRCYFCKKMRFSRLQEIARSLGLNCVVDGTSADDVKDFRPGVRAAEEIGIRSPLREAGFTKDEIREASREMKLPTWNKQPAACLATRFPYGYRLTAEGLAKVGKAEDIIRGLGVSQVRVRHHGSIARIEVLPADFQKLLIGSSSRKVVEEIKRLGYDYVTLDIQGYRSGSMNEALGKKTQPKISAS
jgi:uncharacterized protein